MLRPPAPQPSTAVKAIHLAVQLRGYQNRDVTRVFNAWAAGHTNVALVEPTGAGKTVMFSYIAMMENAPVACIAHRQELVGQISMALASNGVPHRIIAPKKVIQRCSRKQLRKFNRSFVDPNAKVGVAGVDTLIKRTSDQWMKSVRLWIQDECHHVLKTNKWGRACELFPNARGLGVTATPVRADGKGLGRWASGVFDVMVEGATMRELIDQGYLTDYRVICAKSHIDESKVEVGSSGEITRASQKRAMQGNIVGDVVETYLKFTPHKLGVAFAYDVECAEEITAKFCERGITAEVVHSGTDDIERENILERFEQRQTLVLVNVDLFGEGFDLPAIEVVMMARRTESYALYAQQFGRALRLMVPEQYKTVWDQLSIEQRLSVIANSDKPQATIIDHVGNVVRHLLPDGKREFSLDDRNKRGGKDIDPDDMPLKPCLADLCAHPNPRYRTTCEKCGTPFVPKSRGAPEEVDGDLFELDPEVLKKLRGEIQKVDSSFVPIPQGASEGVALARKKAHWERQQAVGMLRDNLAQWGGWQRWLGLSDREMDKRFFLAFGVDKLSAQALPKSKMIDLAEKVKRHLAKHEVI